MMKITKSLAIIGAVAAIAVIGTYAAYHTTASITASTYSAVPMDLKIDNDPVGANYNWTDGFANPHNPFAKVKPGSTGEQIIDIKNVGDTKGKATIQLTRTSSPDNELSGNLFFTVYFDGEHNGFGNDATPIASGPLSAWQGNTYNLGEITSGVTTENSNPANEGQIASVKIKWSVPFSTGNEIMGDSVTIDTIFGLDQVEE